MVQSALEVIDSTVAGFGDEPAVSKTVVANAVLDVRLATEDPTVVAACDAALREMATPTLVKAELARAEFAKLRAVVAASPAPAMV